MNIFDVKTKIEKLTEDINKRNDKYFLDESTGNDDHIYDQLFAELKKLLEEYPEFDTPNSPIHKVGGRPDNTFAQVVHKISMLSLGKAMTWEEFKTWFIDMASKGITEFVFELKYDGLACSLRYENGKLVVGATRGDGKIGDDITVTVLQVPNIPHQINEKEMTEVRGEVLLLKSGLDAINIDRKAKGEKPYENVRNAASGLLRRKTPDPKLSQYLRFGHYMLAQHVNKFSGHTYNMEYLEKEGFKFEQNTLGRFQIDLNDSKYYNNINKALEDIKTYFEKVQNDRSTLDFDIDGIVCKADGIADQKMLGEKESVPNWAIAFKFPSDEKIAQLLDVEWLLGAKGNVTPRAQITPTAIGGTTVTKPTLHNIEELKRLDIKIGDYVVLQRRGDVIPKIDRVLTELRTGNEKEIQIPTICPECGKPLTFVKAFPRCENIECSGRNFSKIRNYIVALEIEEFGPALIEKLIDAGKLNDLTDIYSLTQDDLANLDKMGVKSAKKVIDNINKSKQAPLWKIISGLTIKGVGGESAKDVAKLFVNLASFQIAREHELMAIQGMGPVSVENIMKWLENEDNQTIIKKLMNLGLGSKMEVVEEVKASNKLEGKKFGFTGDLDSMTRKEAEKVITENGGIAHGLKKDTDYILIGKGYKQKKVDDVIRKNPNAKTITEEEFLNIIK